MKEFIGKEKARVQALFEPFNAGGSWMSLAEKGSETIRLGLVDGFLVTRVAPHFDAKGGVTRVDFWLYMRMLGYDEGFHHAHTVKVVSWSQEDTYLLDLVDDRGRMFHIELVFPDQEPDMAADWKSWKKYKEDNRDRFERIDADLLFEHVHIAEEWE
ncbi:MAG: hypothetical protein ABIJ57_01590 [Pseudomonadota bacterium]